jgi:hypothetical protein
MAMKRMVPDEATMKEMLGYARALGPDDEGRFWVAAAAPGWPIEQVGAFLDECERSNVSYLKEAAALAKARKYRKWDPL